MLDVVLIASKIYNEITFTISSNCFGFFFVNLEHGQCNIELIELVFYAEAYQNPVRHLRWSFLRK